MHFANQSIISYLINTCCHLEVMKGCLILPESCHGVERDNQTYKVDDNRGKAATQYAYLKYVPCTLY